MPCALHAGNGAVVGLHGGGVGNEECTSFVVGKVSDSTGCMTESSSQSTTESCAAALV